MQPNAAFSAVVKPQSQRAESPSSTLHRTCHGIPKGVHKNEQFWLEEHRKIVSRCDSTQPWGSMKCQTERVTSKVGRDRGYNPLYDEMMQHLPRGLPNIYFPSLSVSPLPLYVHTPPLRSRSPSSMYLCAPTVTQSPAKLSGASGEKQSFLPQWYQMCWSNFCLKGYFMHYISLFDNPDEPINTIRPTMLIFVLCWNHRTIFLSLGT